MSRTVSGLLVVALALAGCSSDPPAAQATDWAPAFDTSQTGWLLNLWGPAPDDLYAVGGSEAKGTITHFDGKAWSPLATGVDAPLFNWATGFGPNDVTVVGKQGTVLHFDGKAWTKQPTPTDQDLWGVWGASPDDLWAVGGAGLAAGQATLLHFDGRTWIAIALPTLQRANVFQLLKVWGTSSRDVYVVGQRGVVLHYDGQTWTELFVGATDDLVSIWGTGPNRIAAVGGRGNGILATFDGTSWHTISLAPLPGLNGVWMRDPHVVHVVGAYGTLANVDFETGHVDQVTPPTRLDLHSVFGASDGHLFAVGGNLATAHPSSYQGIAFSRVLGAGE